MIISSFFDLKAQKRVKKQELDELKNKLIVDYFDIIIIKDQVFDGVSWWKKISFAFLAYKYVMKLVKWIQKAES